MYARRLSNVPAVPAHGIVGTNFMSALVVFLGIACCDGGYCALRSFLLRLAHN
jgi:hypothetical protein